MPFSVRSVFFLPVLMALAASLSPMPMAAAAVLGTDWTVRNPVRLHSDLLDIAVNGSSNLVAVGAHGAIVSGSNLSTMALVPSGVTDDFLSVAFAGGKYYTAGNRGHILSSSNSTTWTVKYTSTTDIYQCVASSGALVVVAGAYLNSATATFNNVVVTSTDGVNWTRRTFPNMAPITRILWNGQMFVAILDSATATSLDGSSWSIHALPPATATGTAGTRSIVWTGSVYLVSGDTVWRSVDGVVWTEYAALLNGSSGAYLSWTGSELLVSLGSRVYLSTDLVTLFDRSSGQPSSMTYGVRFGSSFVMAGLGGHVDSQDSTGTWSPRFSSGIPAAVRGIAKSSSLYVAVGVNVTWTSTDGNNWTEHAQTGKNFISAAWSGTQFVASGSGIWTSPDGITWTNAVPADANAQQVWTMVTWIGGKGYASGYDYQNSVPLNKTSLDGTTWSAGALSRTIMGMARNTDGSRLLAVGLSGTATYSTDNGATWQGGAVDNGGQDFNDITFGSGKYIAVTSGGAIWSTLDGQTWDRLNVGSGSLNGVTRATNEFIAVGSTGRVLRSFDGKAWRSADSKTSTNLNRILFTNGRLIAAGASANIITSDGDLPVQTTVQFATTSSSMTEGGSVGVVVTLSQESTVSATVTLNYTGSATSADFGGPGATVTIPAGETSAFMVFTATDNNVVSTNGDKTLIITLSNPLGDVALGPPAELVHTITIHDNDFAPSFDVEPADQLAALGAPVVFTAHANGSGNLAYQWKKNNVAIANAKSESLTIARAALTDAASYTVTVTGNVGAPVTSTAAKLGVVTVQNFAQVVKAGATASFPATVKLPTGAQVTYQWRRGAQPLAIGGRITDATAKLTFTGVVAGDTDTYVCDVTMGSGMGAPTMTATTVDYTVLGTVPVITQPAALLTRVASTIDFTPVATGRPTRWTAAPLPPGVVLNATTGRISGKFTTGGQYNVKFTATNLVGPATMTYAITVDALTPATVGTFIALMDRDLSVNTGLGGRLDVTTTATGNFSGKLKLPIADKPFTGVLSGVRGSNPTAVNVPVPTTGLLLTFTIDEATGVITAAVNNGIKVIGGAGVERAVASASTRAGSYNFALAPDANSASGTPQGEGYGQFTLATTGALRITGKLPDGTTFTTDTFTAANGQIPVYIPSATGKGSVMGTITLTEAGVGSANNFISGAPTWYKNEEPTSRSYAAGIPLMTLNADGGRYAAPSTAEIVMKLPSGTGNATLTFDGANLDLASRNPTSAFTVVKPATATRTGTNAAMPTLVFTPTTGLFNGQFVLSDADTRVASHPMLPRTVLYYGVLIRPGGSDVMVGKGFFTLPQMPVGLESLSTSPILSGHVGLTRTALAP